MNGELLSLKRACETLKEVIRNNIQVRIIYGKILWVQYIMTLYCMITCMCTIIQCTSYTWSYIIRTMISNPYRKGGFDHVHMNLNSQIEYPLVL